MHLRYTNGSRRFIIEKEGVSHCARSRTSAERHVLGQVINKYSSPSMGLEYVRVAARTPKYKSVGH